ncbi:MAG: C45 family peptidase [Planctomycetota bacterium]|nr:C45 family peptidase [Planctomycetota bacterium]
MSQQRFPEITVAGTPREMGRQLGEACREQVRGFCDYALTAVNKTVAIPAALATRIANESMAYVQRFSPHLLEELEGLAESADVSVEDLMLLQVRNQFHDGMVQGCTAVALAADVTQGGRTLVAQNWDADPALDAFTVVLTRRPQTDPAYMSVTQAGLISYIGMNAAGFAACVNTLPAPARDVGVPHYFSLRTMFEQSTCAAAVAQLESAHRAIPVNIMTTSDSGPANIEGYVDEVRVVDGDKYLVHTNHCLCSDREWINAEFPELIQSHARQQRMTELLDKSPSWSVSRLQELLSDHDAFPKGICRHANDHPRHGFWVTVFSVIMDPEAGKMYLTRGNPCSEVYETYDLDVS